ncbi:nitrite reductase small subunit NirD [Orbaceae bacterium ESL0721]|nr:nitrite reductase small subunit NirD [Orbaceae bacterium ESL0721]
MSEWITVCKLDDIHAQTGVCALVNDEPVAIFRPYDDDRLYAISNIDPFFHASVLSRGIIAEHQNELWVASPLKKQRFRLKDGYCLEDSNYSIKSYPVRAENGAVQIQIN